MHKGPQKCSCSVNCWIAKLRVFLNYDSICSLNEFHSWEEGSFVRISVYQEYLLILLPLNSIREDLELCAFYRIFMHLKARTMVMLNVISRE